MPLLSIHYSNELFSSLSIAFSLPIYLYFNTFRKHISPFLIVSITHTSHYFILFFVTIPHLQLHEHYTPTPPLHMKCSLHYLVLEMLHNDLISSSSSISRRLQAPLVSQEVEEVQALPAHLTRVDPCQPSTSMLWVQNQFDSEIHVHVFNHHICLYYK